MTETRAPYLTEKVVSDSDTTEALALFAQAGITPRRLLMLAERCYRRKQNGFGRVIMVWVKGQPELLMEEDREMWR